LSCVSTFKTCSTGAFELLLSPIKLVKFLKSCTASGTKRD
jgi:hypothetical protein